MYLYMYMYVFIEGWLIIQCTLWFCCDIGSLDIYIYINIYKNIYIYIQRIIQEFNLSVGSHVSWGLWVGEGDGCFKAPLPILLYITIWLYILIYTLLLYILFFKTINFFPKFDFLASFSYSFLKSNLAIFSASAQIRHPKSDNKLHFGLYYLLIYIYIYLYIYTLYIYIMYIYK